MPTDPLQVLQDVIDAGSDVWAERVSFVKESPHHAEYPLGISVSFPFKNRKFSLTRASVHDAFQAMVDKLKELADAS